ncbi:alpha/beta fold hydrolase BchO [Pannonibacter tanglangensis]|uniref:Alpha/beta fold hydrolase n=1 Tax=Pannonibacter tanglangensis TaxID=2750084 RepID=A0ABW9ZEP3_9HYPH|nr:alpha/beta fold hydrolase BchO [Pannonibacter sp. XCT-34]NBN63138.1 alpha/beta fold hydrolase [Pannonibacter sp. XCT-34]
MTSDRTWLDWDSDGARWPLRETSRFVRAGGYRWHLQQSGPDHAPQILLLHGTGAASFSWRTLVPLLRDRFRLIVPDLPCHGFTWPEGSMDLSPEGMTTALNALLGHLGLRPDLIVGHSAGAVIGLALIPDRRHAEASPAGGCQRVFAVNGALTPIRGNRVLSPIAKALFANPLSASMFSLLASTTPLGRNLVAATGSPIDAEGEALYRLLLGCRGHVRGALGMMASWDLSRLPSLLRRLPVPLDLLAARDDPMVPASSSQTAAGLVRHGSLTLTETGGHLLHECAPETVAAWIGDTVAERQTTGVDAA